MKKQKIQKKKNRKIRNIVLSITGSILLLLLIVIVWVAWGKNQGEQISHTSFLVTDQTPSEADPSLVYMTSDITPEGLVRVYEALGRDFDGRIAVKLHTGEGEDSFHLRPSFIEPLIDLVDGTIIESNTAYGGSRTETAVHMQLAQERGFTEVAPVDILDAEGSLTLPVTEGQQLKENLVGSHLADYDSVIVLSHFKGHYMGGFGGAIKNTSIGIASSEGKGLIHTAGVLPNFFFGMLFTRQNAFLESMAEAAKSVSDYEHDGDDILYINVVNNISVDCDCVANPAEPDMHDIGILASTDPVALDQASVDLVYAADDGGSVIERIESRNGLLTLKHAEDIGLGSRWYELISID